jgi:hypothetical protein
VLNGGDVEFKVSFFVDVTDLTDVYVTDSFGNRMRVSVFFLLISINKSMLIKNPAAFFSKNEVIVINAIDTVMA